MSSATPHEEHPANPPPASLPAGYRLYTRQHHQSAADPRNFKLAVPEAVLHAIEREELERRIREGQEREQRIRDLQAQRALESTTASAKAPTPPSIVRNVSKSTELDALVPTKQPPKRKHTVSVFDWKAALAHFRNLESTPSSPDRQLVKRDRALLAKAMERGSWRRIKSPHGWRDELTALAQEMPNFAPVAQFIAQRLALAELAGAPLHPPPILLLGDPGVGKSHFALRLSESLGTVVQREAFDNAETSSGLRGSDRHWANTSVGALFELIVLGEHANPIILLDELDKGKRGGSGYQPIDSLLTLLEPVTASRIKDLSVQFEFDASYVWYIATANDPLHIPAAVRSRFVEFTIVPPDIDGRLVLAQSIYAATLKRMVPATGIRSRFRPLTNLQVCRLAWLTPRQIRMTVERVLGAAALAGRWHIEDADLDEALPTVMPSAGKSPPRDDDPGDSFAFVLVRDPS
ncbi:hypothetical protein ABIC89_004545 [Variovorax boronicumulans]|uniref:AAA family ATPase n=1 Tax=Variovorax boronicumulans TaxID=436515 RepID=UPI003390E127